LKLRLSGLKARSRKWLALFRKSGWHSLEKKRLALLSVGLLLLEHAKFS
jgi:hypothetical protein